MERLCDIQMRMIFGLASLRLCYIVDISSGTCHRLPGADGKAPELPEGFSLGQVDRKEGTSYTHAQTSSVAEHEPFARRACRERAEDGVGVARRLCG